MDINQIKHKLISENQKIGWVPGHMQEGRFGKWLEGARDWALSRSRYWGAPLPVWKCSECTRVEVIGSVAELQTKFTSNNVYTAMRHGECIGNTQDRADAGKDLGNHLTELGKSQVIETASTFSESDFDLIVHSPVIRAKETAKIVQEHLGLTSAEIVEDSRLSEFDFGVYDGKNFSDFWEKLRTLHYDFDSHLEGSESYRSLQGRLSQLLADCEKKYTGKKILFVTHGAPMWMIKALTENMSDGQAREYRAKTKVDSKAHYFLPNASVLPLDFKPFPHSSHGLDLHRPYIDEMVYRCSAECGGQMKRILDVFDCWYESGSMPFASLHYPFENKELFDTTFPADFIAEGLDQTRGWFYSLLNLSVGLFNKASYKQVIVNGLTMAADGQKMSKSKENFTDPMDLVEKYGADSLRFALINSPLVRGENTAFPDSLVDEASKKLVQRLENVYSFYEMYKDENILPNNGSQNVLDHWIRSRLHETMHSVTSALDNYELDVAARPFESFIDDLSTWYLRRSRDRLKGETGNKDRVHAIETLGYVLLETSKILAPFMPFLSERIYKGFTNGLTGYTESVHLEKWPLGGHIDEGAIINMTDVRSIVTLGLEARSKIGSKVRQPLQSMTVKNLKALNQEYLGLVLDEVNIKEIFENQTQDFEVVLDTQITPELQKEGDYRELLRTVKDLRKEKGLQAGDAAKMMYSGDGSFIEEIQIELQKACGLTSVERFDSTDGPEIRLQENIYKISLI